MTACNDCWDEAFRRAQADEPSVLEVADAERRMAEAEPPPDRLDEAARAACAACDGSCGTCPYVRAFEDLPPGRSGHVPGVDPYGLAGSA